MLFDLRGRGRRRTVQVIYIGLALLMGVGLIGFGIGGGFGGGGLLNAATSNEGASKASFSSEIKKYRKLTLAQPSNVGAWEKLISVELHEAGGEAYVQNNQLTSKGHELFVHVARSWNSYLALNPPKPSPELAEEMVRVLGEEGLNEPPAAVQALQIVVAARPTSEALYATLAEYAYKAHNVREGDLASEKAVSLAPAAQRARLKSELAEVKKNPSGTTEETATSTSGQTYAVKRGANGSITATPKTTPTGSAGLSSSTK
jgi:hypothetical protein